MIFTNLAQIRSRDSSKLLCQSSAPGLNRSSPIWNLPWPTARRSRAPHGRHASSSPPHVREVALFFCRMQQQLTHSLHPFPLASLLLWFSTAVSPWPLCLLAEQRRRHRFTSKSTTHQAPSWHALSSPPSSARHSTLGKAWKCVSPPCSVHQSAVVLRSPSSASLVAASPVSCVFALPVDVEAVPV
jgi:hypothetical protein